MRIFIVSLEGVKEGDDSEVNLEEPFGSEYGRMYLDHLIGLNIYVVAYREDNLAKARIVLILEPLKLFGFLQVLKPCRSLQFEYIDFPHHKIPFGEVFEFILEASKNHAVIVKSVRFAIGDEPKGSWYDRKKIYVGTKASICDDTSKKKRLRYLNKSAKTIYGEFNYVIFYPSGNAFVENLAIVLDWKIKKFPEMKKALVSFADMVKRGHGKFLYELHCLQAIDGRLVSGALVVRSDTHSDRVLYQVTGFDNEFKNVSPGWLLLEKMVSMNPNLLIDYGVGEEEYKCRFGNFLRYCYDFYFFRHGFFGMILECLVWLKTRRGSGLARYLNWLSRVVYVR